MCSNKVFNYLEKHNKMDKVCNIILCELLLYTDFNYNDLKKLLKGGYFIIKDNGYLYNKWKKYSKNNDNILKNSHYSCNKCYRLGKNKIFNINGNINHNYDCIIGTICYDKNLRNDNVLKNHKNCYTWFQFEKTRLNNMINILKHSVDYINYFFFRKNIGPFGNSHNTEKYPIILKFKK